MKYLTLLCFTFISLHICNAQEKVYRPDSIISYRIIELDTVGKIPVYKTVYTYDANYNLKSSKAFNWDSKTSEWRYTMMNEYSINGNTIVKEQFALNQKSGQLEAKAKETFVYEKFPDNIKTHTHEVKKSVDSAYALISKEEYTYEKGNLKSKTSLRKGTSGLFTSASWEYDFSKNKIEIAGKKFKEGVTEPTLDATVTCLFNKNIISKYTDYHNEKMNNSKLVYEYSKDNKLVSTKLNVDSSSRSNARAKNQTNYNYTSTGHLDSKFEYVTDEVGNPSKNPYNTYVKYYCNTKSPILNEGVGLVIVK